MNDEQADGCVRRALLQVVPQSDVAQLSPDEPLRDALEMDSLDFLSFVEHLSAEAQVRIEEDDYPQLVSYADCVRFVSTAPVITTG